MWNKVLNLFKKVLNNNRKVLDIIKMDTDISELIYTWLCNHKGKQSVCNHNKMFVDILKELGVNGKLLFTNLRDNEFDVLTDKGEKYEVYLLFGDLFDTYDAITVKKENVSKLYVYYPCKDEFVLESVLTVTDNIKVNSCYDKYFTTYYIITQSIKLEIRIYEPKENGFDCSQIIAHKRDIIQNKLVNFIEDLNVKNVISMMVDCYGKDFINDSEEVQVCIYELVEKEQTLISKLVINYGKINVIFQKKGVETVSIDLEKDNLEFCNRYSNFIMHNNRSEISLQINKISSEVNVLSFKKYSEEQIDILLAEAINILLILK